MSDKQQFLITVRFPGWTQSGHKYAAYGIKFLFEMGVIPFPEWESDDERWLRWSEEDVAVAAFKKAFETTRNKEFDGEVLFVEPSNIVVIKQEGKS